MGMNKAEAKKAMRKRIKVHERWIARREKGLKGQLVKYYSKISMPTP